MGGNVLLGEANNPLGAGPHQESAYNDSICVPFVAPTSGSS